MDTKRLATAFSLAGRNNYEHDHVVVPVLAMMAESNGIIIRPHPNLAPTPPQAYCEIIYRLGRAYPWSVFVTVSETWLKEFAHDDALIEDLSRGDLELLHGAGDLTVRTCVHTFVLDPRRPSASYSISATVLAEDPVEWDIFEFAGQATGDFPDMMLRAFMEAEELPEEIGTPPLPLIAACLVEADLAVTATLVND